MDGKGRLRSAWTHAVDLSPWHQNNSAPDPYGQPGTPSKAPTNPQLAWLQERGRHHCCFGGKLDREIFCNALACAGASMADPLMSMVDTYYAGKLGTTALAALGANGALYSVIYFLCFTALAVLCTQAMAAANSRGDAQGCGRGFLQAVAATWVVSLMLVAVLLLAPEQVLSLFAEPKVMPYAKTYCMIRALSLPAALTINVCQAAFRSLLDLTTPFCVVMAANAANYVLDHVLMFGLGWGMSGCGWASVISQYIGAVLFAAIIYVRRHQFGIPAALTAAAEQYADMHEMCRQPAWHLGSCWPWAGTSTVQQMAHKHKWRSRLSPEPSSEVARKNSDSFRIDIKSPLRLPSSRASKQDSCTAHPIEPVSPSVITARAASLLHRAAVHHHGGVMPEVTLTGQGVTRRTLAVDDGRVSAGSDDDSLKAVALHRQRPQSGSPSSRSPKAQHKHRHKQHKHSLHDSSRAQNGAASWGDPIRRMFDYQSLPGKAIAAVLQPSVAMGSNVGQQPGMLQSDGNLPVPAQVSADTAAQPLSDYNLHWDNANVGDSTDTLTRLDSVGSDSKLPRFSTSTSSLQRLMILLSILDWSSFIRRFLGMTVRGLLILSTYTSANLVAAKEGAATMAAHQVVQQQQQLQMSFAWSFLHVGQSMTANVYHASSGIGGGPKAARRLAQRIVCWSACSCVALSLMTYSNRWYLSGVFTQDASVRQLVSHAAAPASAMLSLAWNNALEGCLLAAGDQAYVVKVYPWAAISGVASLLLTWSYNWGLPGVWWGLMLYYLVLLVGFGARMWIWRSKL